MATKSTTRKGQGTAQALQRKQAAQATERKARSNIRGTMGNLADKGGKPVGADKHAQAQRREADSDDAVGAKLAQTVIAESEGQSAVKGTWNTYLGSLYLMVPAARIAFMKALRTHRDAVKARAKEAGTTLAEKAANAANVMLSNFLTIAGAFNSGMAWQDDTPFTHTLAAAREYRGALAAQEAAQEVTAEAARLQRLAGMDEATARKVAEAQQAERAAEKRGRKATPFGAFVVAAAEKRGATPADIQSAVEALSALLKPAK